MAFTIDQFRSLAAKPYRMLRPTSMDQDGRALASIKVSKPKGDGEPSLQIFGTGKGFRGEELRKSGNIFSKIYAFFHDPSGSANRSLRRQFVEAFKKEYGELGKGIEQHIDVKSRKPLNAAQVSQLIASADQTRASTKLELGSVEISHSRFKDTEALERSFDQMAGKMSFGPNGSRTLNLMYTLDAHGRDLREQKVMREASPEPSKPQNRFAQDQEGGMGFRMARRINNKPKEQDNAPTVDLHRLDRSQIGSFDDVQNTLQSKELEVLAGTSIKSPNIELARLHVTASHQYQDANLSIGMLAYMIPRDVRDDLTSTALFPNAQNFLADCDRGEDLKTLAMAGEQLMVAVQNGDNEGIKAAGETILKTTQSMQKAVDRFLEVLLDPAVRDLFIAKASRTEGHRGEVLGLEIYNTLVFGAQQMRTAMSDENGGFHGLIALGAIAAARPELALERLSREVPVKDLSSLERPLEELRHEDLNQQGLAPNIQITEIQERTLTEDLDEKRDNN